MLKIFLSWSGAPSRQCAELLRDNLPIFNPSIEPFVSSADIRKGDRGLQRIAEELEGSSFGIVCVTPANLGAPWINFESGALSREVVEGKVIPFLLGAGVRDLVDSPLKQFQAVVADSRSDVLAMVQSIDLKCEPPHGEARISQVFEKFWPELQKGLQKIALTAPEADEDALPPQRRTEEILDDLLPLIREQIDRITDLERAVTELRVGRPNGARRRVPFGGIYDDGGSGPPVPPGSLDGGPEE
ncbi:toll/interleukin-1 receptor domain-containing protein [Streptacidiphilus sp. N1-3]|uniref:Toll/interleukin-1 receptor domain-containing protein n=1 Tax=Streptacidiphilus alkalitolerans TaxID=3342712 RepID=A0ABV6WU21_9ACTN